MQITYFEYTMAQDIHCHFKMEERENSKEILDQNKTKSHLGKLQTLHSPCLMSKRSSDLQLLSVLLPATYFSPGLLTTPC